MVRIAVQLVRASDGFSAWSGRFDRRLDDISRSGRHCRHDHADADTARPDCCPFVTSKTSNHEAYSPSEGRYLWNKRPGDVVWQALSGSSAQSQSTRHFAPAYAALASVYGTLGA